jgi:hypothetical protein
LIRPAATGTVSAATDAAALFASISTSLEPNFESMDWAEDEIAKATARHPEQADVLYHAFTLLRPRDIGPGMGTEFVYRGHVRELLERIATGADTRPGTAAEICLAFSEISQIAPMRESGNGLYFRMWLAAFPDQLIFEDQAEHQIHYERLHSSQIDDAETLMRAKLADPGRRLRDIECAGRHHGETVTCRYATTG